MDRFFGMFESIRKSGVGSLKESSLYDGICAEFYASTAELFGGDLHWYIEHLPRDASEVLELCCGAGRLAAGLAAAGHRVTGVDNASDMLDRARGRASDVYQAGPTAEFVLADALDLDLGRTFDAVVLGGLSLSTFLGRSDRERLLSTVNRHLRPGGVFLFDHMPVETGDGMVSEYHGMPCMLSGARGFVLLGTDRSVEQRLQRSNFYFELDHGDRTSRVLSANALTLFSDAELEAELTAHGFAVDTTRTATPAELTAEQFGTKIGDASRQSTPLRLVRSRQ